MGSIYEALTRNQNLKPLSDAVRGYVKKKQDEEKLQNFLTLMDQKKQEAQNLYQVPDETTYQAAPVPQNNFLSRLKRDEIGQPTQQGMGLDVNVPQGQIVPNDRPKPFQLQDIGQVTTGTKPGTMNIDKLKEANKNADMMALDVFTEGTRNQLAPEQIQQAMNMIAMIKQGNQPEKKNIQTIGDGQDLIEIDPYGKVNPIYQNEKQKTGNPQYQWHKIGEGVKDGKKYAIEENILTGKKRETELGEKEATGGNTTVNVNTEPDVSKLIGEINNISRDIRNGKLEASASDYAYSQLEGKTEELVDRYGLKGSTNLVWARINKGKSINEAIGEIDKYQQEVEGQEPFTPREKDYLQLYFNSRIIKK